MDALSTDEVFGVTRGVPLNYVPRENADALFTRSLERSKHIVLHGSSKQGKTALRKQCLPGASYITIQCLSSWDLTALHTAILKEVGYEVVQSTTRTTAGKYKGSLSLKAGFHLPFFSSASGELKGEGEHANTTTHDTKPFDIDLEDVNDIIRVLSGANFGKFIILEDFHYLPEDTQKHFSTALKAYHERSQLAFIIVGVWLESDRLASYNGDLSGRLTSVNVDHWSPDELQEVISKGEQLLNVVFPADFKSELIANAFESVYLIQEACNKALQDISVYQSSLVPMTVRLKKSAAHYIREVVTQENARYMTFLRGFADGFRDTSLKMYKYLLFPVICASADDLSRGLRQRDIRDSIRSVHPEGLDLNPGNIGIALKSVASLQTKHAIRPLILDYDQTENRLQIVDRSFLVWLQMQDRKELLAELDLPC